MGSKATLQLEDLAVDSFHTTAAYDCTAGYDRTCSGNGTCGVYPCRRYDGTL